MSRIRWTGRLKGQWGRNTAEPPPPGVEVEATEELPAGTTLGEVAEEKAAECTAGSATIDKERMTVSEKRQITVAMVEAAAAVLALIIATYTYQQQTKLNAQQQLLNVYAKNRDERKYSTRVAIWSTAGDSSSSVLPPGIDLSIQNRSPVPLRNVHVLASLKSGQTGNVTLADIPPCTIEKHRIAAPSGDVFVRTGDRLAGFSGLWLQFWVDGRHWKLTSDQLTEALAPASATQANRLRNIPIDNTEPAPGKTDENSPQEALVQDCGEGG